MESNLVVDETNTYVHLTYNIDEINGLGEMEYF